MRQSDYLRVCDQLRLWKIRNVCFQLAAIERGQRGIVIHDAAASEVDQHPAIVHQRDALAIDEILGAIQKRHVNRHEIGMLEQLIERLLLLDAGRQLPGIAHGDGRVVADNFHTQLERRVGDFHAYGA